MNLSRKHRLALVAFCLATCSASALACTPLGVGKAASTDGSVLVTHTCDGIYDQRIQIIPGGEHKEGEMIEIFGDPCVANQPAKPQKKLGEIPQVAKTYTFFNVGYPFMNEKGVLMGEFTWSGRDEVMSSAGMMYIANLEQLGLQRAATAREAVKVMGEIAEKYGYCDGGETLIVADEKEAWVFEVCGGGLLWQQGSDAPGAHWVATRIPDDAFFVGANRARTGDVNFEDKENVMHSRDLTKLAESMGWWKQGEPFNFAKIFNPQPYGSPLYQPLREWRALTTFAPSGNWELVDDQTAYPMFVKPDQKISVQDLMKLYGDHMEGTDYDTTKGLAAGPFGCPNRWPVPKDLKPEGRKNLDWPRTISVPRCSYSFVASAKEGLPEPVKSVLWFGEDVAETTVYVPIFNGVTKVPEPWTKGVRHEFDRDSAWWAFNLVNNWACLRWDAMYPVIKAEKDKYEGEFFADVDKIRDEVAGLYKESPEKAIAKATDYTYGVMDKVEKGWWNFAFSLIGRFYDGGMIDPESQKFVALGYPTEYLEQVDFAGQEAKDLEIIKNKKQ